MTVDVIVKPAVDHYIFTIKECLWSNGEEVYCCALLRLPFVCFYGTPLIFPSFVTSDVPHVHALLRVQVLTYNTGMVAYSKESLWQQACPICLRHAGGNFCCIWAATKIRSSEQ